MGALPFHVRRHADNVEDAFHRARNDAIVDNGCAGYSGSIADKSGFSAVTLPPTITYVHLVRELRDRNDDLEHSDSIDRVIDAVSQPAFERAVAIYNDKHGPVLAIQTAEKTWDFLGWAPW